MLKKVPYWFWAGFITLIGTVAVGLTTEHLPFIHDEFAYLFAGETYSRGLLTNPTHPLWQFFESHQTLIQPSMMAKYPMGQGVLLGIGFLVGNPIFGVWISIGVMASAMSWMLRGFVSEKWSIVGGLLIGAQLGLAHYWAQSFWGGSLATIGGALVFGGAKRVWDGGRVRDALLMGSGVAILMHTRPFEGMLASLVPAGVFLWKWYKEGLCNKSFLKITVAPCVSVVLAAFILQGYYNYRVTGTVTQLPYLEYEKQYLGMKAFIWQTDTVVHKEFTNVAAKDFYYDYSLPIKDIFPNIGSMFLSHAFEVLFYCFGMLIGVLALFGVKKENWTWLIILNIVICSSPLYLSYLFTPHYSAPYIGSVVVLAVLGIERIYSWFPCKVRWMLFLGLAIGQYTTSRFTHLTIEGREGNYARIKINQELQDRPKQQLVLVKLEKPYDNLMTWVFNYAPIDNQKVIWAWDRGVENTKILEYYPDREVTFVTVNDSITKKP